MKNANGVSLIFPHCQIWRIGNLESGGSAIYGENPADTNEPKAGEPFARTYDYSGFGRVENPAAKNNQVKVRVELQNSAGTASGRVTRFPKPAPA